MTDLCFFQGRWEGGASPSAQDTPQAKWPAPRLDSSLWLGPREPRPPHTLVVSLLPIEEDAAESPGAKPDSLAWDRGSTGCDRQGRWPAGTQPGWWPSLCGFYCNFAVGPEDQRGSGQRTDSQLERLALRTIRAIWMGDRLLDFLNAVGSPPPSKIQQT